MGTQGSGRGPGCSGTDEQTRQEEDGARWVSRRLEACVALSLGFRLGIHQLRLVRGPHRIVLSTEELTFVHQPPSRRVSEGVGGPLGDRTGPGRE